MVKAQNNKGQFRITIPKDIAKLRSWKQGTEVAFIQDKSGNIMIKEIKKGRKSEKKSS